MFLRSAGGMAPPNEAITRPRGSVTRKMASAREIFDHNSPAVSWIVAWSPVPNASRTSGSLLRMLLTDDNSSTREFHNDVYAAKLAWTSSSRLSDIVLVMWFRTIWPVMANNTVTATDVDNRIFQSKDSRENHLGIIAALPDTFRRYSPADTPARICSGAAPEQIRFRKWK